jgi:hypothetical protein
MVDTMSGYGPLPELSDVVKVSALYGAVGSPGNTILQRGYAPQELRSEDKQVPIGIEN